jgi:GxxExxY protein
LSFQVIGAAIEVHMVLGPGLLESIYETCLGHELSCRQIGWVQQERFRVRYKDLEFDQVLKFDLLVEECLLVEVKSVQELHGVHQAQLLSYMKLMDVPLGLLINFHELKLVDGVKRLVLPGAGQ